MIPEEDVFCVYLITYEGCIHPKFYIGSTSIEKIDNGYLGSASSKKYKLITKLEQKENPELYSIEIIEKTKTRKEALYIENRVQRELKVVESNDFWNMSYASVNGFFGMDVSGSNSPRYGTSHTKETKKKIGDAERGKNNHNWGGITCPSHLKNMSIAKMGDKNGMYKIGSKHFFYGKHHSEATKAKIRNTKLSKPSKICPWCSFQGKSSGSAAMMKRWHFDNCKHKPHPQLATNASNAAL